MSLNFATNPRYSRKSLDEINDFGKAILVFEPTEFYVGSGRRVLYADGYTRFVSANRWEQTKRDAGIIETFVPPPGRFAKIYALPVMSSGGTLLLIGTILHLYGWHRRSRRAE